MHASVSDAFVNIFVSDISFVKTDELSDMGWFIPSKKLWISETIVEILLDGGSEIEGKRE